MILTLHNINIMKNNNMPFHGALIKIKLKSAKESTILIIGDTGVGKSESLEALRVIGKDLIADMNIIADDMGSIELEEGNPIGYGMVMSKGTTTSTGLTQSYFANIFGPPQYRELHDRIAKNYFETFFKKDIFVSQIRTRLGRNLQFWMEN
jgi:energy-coupling factor transporter ATP-binding protein EcfA2